MFQSYVEPSQNSEENIPTTNNTTPLTEGALLENFGIPILVLVCKTETYETLESEYRYKDYEFEYIQQHLRRICLKHGASLIYTSAKKNINCDLIKEYLEHLFFKSKFKHQAQVVDKNEIFVPIGWDSLAKIKIDFENQKLCNDPETPYDQVIKCPEVKQNEEKKLVTAENEQAFLLRHSVTTPTLPKDDQTPNKSFSSTPVNPITPSNNFSSPSKGKSTTPKTNTELNFSPIKTPSTPSTPTSSDTDHEKLANFFNSLINKKKTPKKGENK